MPVHRPFRDVQDPNTGEMRNIPARGIRGKIGPNTGNKVHPITPEQAAELKPWHGTYQSRVTGYNNTGRIPGRPRRRYYVKMRDCTPSNPRTYKQQVGRRAFRIVHNLWQLLTNEQKANYNERGKGSSKNGYNIFLSENLKRRADYERLGRSTYGVAKYGGGIIFTPQ